MAQYTYHDGFPYKLKIPRNEDKGKHYFPVYGRDGRILYWVRRDLLEKIPWIYFSVPGFVEEDLILDYDDFADVPNYDTATFEQVLDAADATRNARFEADRARVQQAHELLGILEAEGVPLRGGQRGGVLWTLAAFFIVVIVGFYMAATMFVFPKVVIRGLTKNTNISLPWGNVCRTPSGNTPQDILRDASQLFGTTVEFNPEISGVKPVMSGRCFDGVILEGAEVTSVTGSSAVLVSMTGVADMPSLLPGIAKENGGCIFPLPAHPGKGLCQNVGPLEGNVQLIPDAAYWIFVNEPDLKPVGRKDEVSPPPTAVVP